MKCMATIGFDKEHPKGLGERGKIGRDGNRWRERKRKREGGLGLKEYYKRRMNTSDPL